MLRALEKDPELRFPGMEELGRALAGAPARNTVLEVAPPPAATRVAGRGGARKRGRNRPQGPRGMEPSTTFSSSVGQMEAVHIPYARSTLHIRTRRQAIAALLSAGLAGAAAIAFFMNGGFRARTPAHSAGPAAVEATAQPPAAGPAGTEAPPPTATEPPPPAAHQPLRSSTPPVPELPAAVTGTAPRAGTVVVPAIPDETAARARKVVVPAIPDQPRPRVPEIARPDENARAAGEAPARAARTRKLRGRDTTGRNGFAAVPDPPPPDPAPARTVTPPPLPPTVVPPPPPPSKPRVNTEKW